MERGEGGHWRQRFLQIGDGLREELEQLALAVHGGATFLLLGGHEASGGATEDRVEAVFHGIFRLALKLECDLAPLGPETLILFEEQELLERGPFAVSSEAGGQRVEPTFSNLFARPALNFLGRFRPERRAVHTYPFAQFRVFYGRPLAFLQAWLQYLRPPVQALDRRTAGHR